MHYRGPALIEGSSKLYDVDSDSCDDSESGEKDETMKTGRL